MKYIQLVFPPDAERGTIKTEPPENQLLTLFFFGNISMLQRNIFSIILMILHVIFLFFRLAAFTRSLSVADAVKVERKPVSDQKTLTHTHSKRKRRLSMFRNSPESHSANSFVCHDEINELVEGFLKLFLN